MLVALVVAFGLMFLWQSVIAPRIWPQPEPTERAPGEAAAPQSPAATESPAAESAAPEAPPPAPSVTAPAPETPVAEAPAPGTKVPELVAVGATGEEADATWVLGSDKYESAFDLEVEVQARGGAVRRLALARHRFFKTVADRNEKDPDQRLAMELVEPTAPFAAFAISELRVWFAGADGPSVVDLSEVAWRLEQEACTPTEAVASVEVQTADGKPAVRITKRYTMRPHAEPDAEGAEAPPQYELGLAVEIEALGEGVERAAYVLRGSPALSREDARQDFRMAVAGSWTEKGVAVETVAGKSLGEPEEGKPAPSKSLGGPGTAWAGEVEKYFAVVLIPQKPSPEVTFAAGAEAFRYEVTEYDRPVPMAGVRLLTKEQALGADKPVRNLYIIYAGPKDTTVLDAYADIGLPELISWKPSCCPVPGISTISRTMTVVLEAFHAVVGNYGMAIVMLVVMLRTVLHPVARWRTKSMSKMQRLGPRMQEIRERHAGNKERLNAEMMKMYREEGINPISSFLPMFVEMPIWIGLYSALLVAINLRHAAFLPAGWVDWMPWQTTFLQDLAQPDCLVILTKPWYLPGTGIWPLNYLVGWIQNMLGGGITSFNLLPLLMAVFMYLQQKFTPTPTTGPQAQQQKHMMVFMTVFLLLVLYSAPAGLCLYILTSALLGFLEQRYLKKRFAAVEAAAAGGGAPGAPTPPRPPKQASVVAGRSKSLAERIEAWLRKRLQQGRKP